MLVREEINKFAKEENKPILLGLLKKYHWSSCWSFVAEATFERYGKSSTQKNRVWEPTEAGRVLCKQPLPNSRCS